jgi:hypothetical protein
MENRLRQVIKEIKNIVDHPGFDHLQSYYDLKGWDIGQTQQVENGILATKLMEDDRMMRFSTAIEPGAAFGLHWHDCIEVCRVQAGTLMDKQTGRKWIINETAVFPAGVPHIPANAGDGYLYLIVDFYKI